MRTFVATLLVIGSLTLDASAQQAPPLFRTSVNMVPISALVRDARGRIVTSLTAADFEVIDKGERRPILDFQVDRSSPLTMAVLVDVSGSMHIGSKLPLVRMMLSRLVAEAQDGRDEVGLFTFDQGVRQEHDFTDRPATMDVSLESVQPFGNTSLYDAIAGTARRLAERPSPRRAVVVLTDGLDTSSALTPGEVSGLASSIDVPVYVVVTVPRMDQALYLGNPESQSGKSSADLRHLAQWTGGDLLWVTQAEEAAPRASQIVTELRHQYLIAIESAAGREWRPIDLRVRNPRLTVRARSGYFGQEPAGAR